MYYLWEPFQTVSVSLTEIPLLHNTAKETRIKPFYYEFLILVSNS